MKVDTTSSLIADLHQQVKNCLAGDYDRLTVRRAVVGIFFSGVELDNGACGLSATPIKSIPSAVCCTSSLSALPAPGKLRGRPVADLLKDLDSGAKPMRRTLAIATLNALIETLWQSDGAPKARAITTGDALSLIDLKGTEKVVLVGAFAPYMREFRRTGQDYRVLELDASTLKPEELPFFVPAQNAADIIPWADVLIATATTLINDTMDGLLASARTGAQIAIIGPTAPLLPAPFLERGVTIVGGTRVRDSAAVLDLLSEGASGFHLFERSVDRISMLL